MGQQKVSYWKVTHSPDLTETGLPMQRTFIRAIWVGHPGQQNTPAVLENLCLERFGPRTAYVQGVAPVSAWQLNPSSVKEWETGKGIRWGGYENPPRRIEVACGKRSNSDPEYTVSEAIAQTVRLCPHCGKDIEEA